MPKTKGQCNEIKKATKQKIIDKSILYFSRNGFSGTRISDLADYIGIGQGTIYNYFESKEALYSEINKIINSQDIRPMKQLVKLPLHADQKIRMLSEYVIKQLKESQEFAAVLTLSTQQMYEQEDNMSSKATYQCEAYELLEKIVVQGQREGSVVDGDAMKLVDYYWGVAYLYALKKMFTNDFILIDADDLSRVLLK